MKRLAAALALLGAAAQPALAQHIEGRVAVQRLTYSLSDNGTQGRLTGTMLGGALTLQLGALHLGVAGQTGQLAGGDSVLTSRDLRSTTLNAGIQATPWMEFGAMAIARREAQDTSVILQRLGGAYVHITPMLGYGDIQGLVDFAYFPLTSVANVDNPKFGLAAGIGVRFAPANGPVLLQISYRLFRIDHQATTTLTPRLEQDQGLMLEVGLRH